MSSIQLPAPPTVHQEQIKGLDVPVIRICRVSLNAQRGRNIRQMMMLPTYQNVSLSFVVMHCLGNFVRMVTFDGIVELD